MEKQSNFNQGLSSISQTIPLIKKNKKPAIPNFLSHFFNNFECASQCFCSSVIYSVKTL